MEALLDFSVELDISLLDRVVNAFFSGAGQERSNAQKVLTQFQEHPDSWKKVAAILDHSSLLQSKYIALQILETLIKTMWKVLPVEERQGIKTFIVKVIMRESSDDVSLEKNRVYLGKLNVVLVQILKQDWPHNWPTFISEIVSSSNENLSLCENNMAILKLLSEEIFDFSAEQMTQIKTKNLKNQMCGEFSEIFKLCHEILENANKDSLIKATLGTLLRFLNWIPLGYIFETNLITILKERFLSKPAFRNVTLKCLTEISGLQIGPEYNERFVLLFSMVMSSIQNMIPVEQDLSLIYEDSPDSDQEFIQNLALFLTTIFGVHLKVIELAANVNSNVKTFLQNGHYYLVRISHVREREIFKICIEYWLKMVCELFEEMRSLPNVDTPILNLSPGIASFANIEIPSLRKNIYTNILAQLRVCMIERMVKPEEVLIVENDEGEIVREFVKETDTIVIYKTMKEILVYLTHLDVENTEIIMSEKLAKQMDGSEWSWDNINTLCWAIGSISGAMNEETEKRFLVTVIKDLLSLTEMKRGKDNKAVVAGNIMYVVGQYPRFLKAHWKFLKTVVNKLFEFMHESHEGVQDMACDTFIKISQKCRKHFTMQHSGEMMPFIEEIIVGIGAITSDLSNSQINTFYEAVGYMVSAQPNIQHQRRLIEKLMEKPNSSWDNLLTLAAQDVECLNDPENIKILGQIMKTNVAACSSIGQAFSSQIERIFAEMLNLYRAVSGLISASVVSQGLVATKTPRVRGFRTIKKEILKLVENFVQKVEDPAVKQEIAGSICSPLLEAILIDYRTNVEPARDAEVLSVTATIFLKLEGLMNDYVYQIFEAVFECTLTMISRNFEDYPEHRVGFYKLLQAINMYCFSALISLPTAQFKYFMDSIVWAFKHTMRDISETGLQICMELLQNFSKVEPSISNVFYQQYFVSILQDILYVLTNSFHANGFKSQSLILMQMFNTIEDNLIQAPLFDPSTVPNPNITNKQYLLDYVSRLLHNAFPHLNTNQITQFVIGLFTLSKDYPQFKNHLRDFLIQLKEFAGDVDLYAEEKEQEAAMKKAAELEKSLAIPGLVKPSDRPDEGMMD